MRKIYDPTETFVYGVRSDYNGPVMIEEHKTSTLMEDDPFYLFYKVAKPYSRYTGSLTEPRYATITNSSGFAFNFSVPEAYKMIEATMAEADRQFEESIHDLFSDKAYVINRAIERSQAYGDLLMLVSASEAKQTVRMIRTVFIRLFRIVLDIYNKVKKLDAFGTLDVVTNIWLEYRYGWTPLIGELGAVKEALTVIRPEGIKSAYATFKPDTLLRDSLVIRNVNVSDTLYDCVFDAYFEDIDEVTRKAGFNYINKPQSRNDSWSAIFGVDVDSLASTAWELIPFSFIIDMFFNFGNLLQARDFTDQVDSFNGWMTCRLNGKLRFDFKKVMTKPMYPNPPRSMIPSTDEQYYAILDNLPFVRIAAVQWRDIILDWNHRYSACNYSLDPNDQEVISLSNGTIVYEETWPKAGIWTTEMKTAAGKFRLLEDLTIPKNVYEPGRPFHNQMYRDQVTAKYCKPYQSSTAEENAVGLAYFNLTTSVISTSVMQSNLDEAYTLKLAGMTAYKLREPSHKLNGYLFRVETAGFPPYRPQYYTDFTGAKRKVVRYGITDKRKLKQFNQSIDIQLLDRTLMPEFKQSLTADLDLSSAQYADLTAFAFKLGNYFRNLK